MYYRTPSIVVPNFAGGLNDQLNNFALRPNELSVCNNFMTVGGSLQKRFGYQRRIATAYSGTPKITGLAGFKDTSYTAQFVATTDGKFLLDSSGSWSDKTGTAVTLSATNLCQMTPIGRFIAGTDGANVPFIYRGGTSNLEVLSSDLTRCSCMAEHKGFLFVGDPTFRGTRIYSQVRYSTVDDPTVFADGLSDTNKTSQALAMVPTADYILIFLEDQLWYAVFAPTSGGIGAMSSIFEFRVLDPSVGIVGQQALASIPGQATIFWGRGQAGTGPYLINQNALGGTIGKPKYIGGRIETCTAQINPTYMSGIVAGHMPKYHGVLFEVPFGAAQTTNNYGVFYNYDDNSFSIFKGDSDNAYAFASAATIVNTDGTLDLYTGGYNGLVYKHTDATLKDDTENFECEAWTGYIGGAGVQKLWRTLSARLELGYSKNLTFYARLFGSDTEWSDPISGGQAGDPIGAFAIGMSAIAGQSIGELVGDIYGDPSDYIQIGFTDAQDDVQLKIHQLVAYYEGASSWAKIAASA